MEKAWKENPRYVRISLCVALVLTWGLLMTAVYACLQREAITMQNTEIARLKAEIAGLKERERSADAREAAAEVRLQQVEGFLKTLPEPECTFLPLSNQE